MELTSLLDIPLPEDLCQEIDFRAHVALLNQRQGTAPWMLDHALSLRQAVAVRGVNACIRHPADITAIYTGVNTRHFLKIQELYCHRLGRSIETIVAIMKAQAYHAGVEPLQDEAVWAICMFLNDLRQQNTSMTIQKSDASWAIMSMTLAVETTAADGAISRPSLILVLDLSQDRVTAFKTVSTEAREEYIDLAFYDALTAARRPCFDDEAGLAWLLPKTLLVDPLDMNSWLKRACAELSIEVATTLSGAVLERSKTLRDIQGFWSALHSRPQRAMSASRFELVFDRSLFSIQGTEPKRAKEAKLQQFSNLRGYSQDPASMLPALRWLLPVIDTEVVNGSMLHRDLHYTHDLLQLWPGRLAQLRVSAESEARAWVYFGNEVVCEAFAVELRRKDGSYRPNR